MALRPLLYTFASSREDVGIHPLRRPLAVLGEGRTQTLEGPVKGPGGEGPPPEIGWTLGRPGGYLGSLRPVNCY